MKIGDRVRWTSQAKGSTVQKMGRIVEVVRPGFKPSREWTHLHRSAGCGCSRRHESYVVLRTHSSRPGLPLVEHSTRKPYWPNVSALVLVDEG